MPRKHIIINLDRKKAKPRGNPDATIPYRQKKGDPGLPGAGRPKGAVGAKKISEAYQRYLGDKVPEDVAAAIGIPVNSTWADAIAYQQLRQAIIRPNGSMVDQTAVTELREVTEGKLADKNEFSGNAPLVSPSVNFHFAKPKQEESDNGCKSAQPTSES